MNTNVYAEGLVPAGPQHNEVGKPTPQKSKAPARKVWPAWLVPAALIMLVVIPLAGGAFRLTQLAERRGDHTRERPLLCVAPAGGAAYRQRQPLYHPGRLSVRPQPPSAAAQLASHRRLDPDPLRPGGGAFGDLDDSVLSLA